MKIKFKYVRIEKAERKFKVFLSDGKCDWQHYETCEYYNRLLDCKAELEAAGLQNTTDLNKLLQIN